jgi:hypothetical protein
LFTLPFNGCPLDGAVGQHLRRRKTLPDAASHPVLELDLLGCEVIPMLVLNSASAVHDEGAVIERKSRLRDLLLDHLQNAAFPAWPGGDCLTVQEVLQTYPDQATLGRVPDREQLLAHHPDLHDELIAFFHLDGL